MGGEEADTSSSPPLLSMIKLIATDFDGTLVPDNGVYEDLADDVHRLLLRLQQQGTECIIATGRYPGYIAKRIKKMAFPTVIGFTGNMTYVDGRIDAFRFERQELKEIANWVREYTPFDLSYRTQDNTVVYLYPEHRAREAKATPEQKRKKDMGLMAPLLIDAYLEQKEMEPIVRVMIRALDMTPYPAVKAKFEQDFPKFRLVRTGGTAIDVMTYDRSKASEIERIMALRGLSENEVATIGDGENDYEMLKRFQNSFYVGPENAALERAAGCRKTCIQEALAAILEMNEG